MTDTLLPCPFCGGEAKLKTARESDGQISYDSIYVACLNCMSAGLSYTTYYNVSSNPEEEAIAAWNRRTGKDINVTTNADRLRELAEADKDGRCEGINGGIYMSKTRYGWWSYVKNMIRRYPALKEQYEDLHSQSVTASYSGMPRGGGGGRALESLAVRELPSTKQREYEAVRRAVETTTGYRNGADRLKVIRLVLWDRSHTVEGAAIRIPCSPATAWRWHAEFIRLTASYYGLMDED